MSKAATRASVQDKLEKTRYFLSRMQETEGREGFRYNVSAFVSAAKSLTEIMQKKSQHLPGFRDWHRANISDPVHVQGSDWHILTETRRLTNHTDALRLDAPMEEVSIPFGTGDPGRDEWNRRIRFEEYRQRERNPFYRRPSRIVMPGQQVKEYRPRWFFPEIQNRDAFTVCREHYERLSKLVEEFVSTFLR